MKTKSATLIFVCVAMIVTLLLTLVPANIRRVDLTVGDIYELSDTSKSFLGELDDEITIYVIDPDGTNYKFELFLELFEEV